MKKMYLLSPDSTSEIIYDNGIPVREIVTNHKTGKQYLMPLAFDVLVIPDEMETIIL